MTRVAVVAVGGNALTAAGEQGTWQQIRRNTAGMAAAVAEVLDAGWQVVVVHGNGPQVGSLAIQQEEAVRQVPPQPLHLLTAMTQGQLGSLLVQELDRLRGEGSAAALVSHVTVDPDDPAFDRPTKPIGPFLKPQHAQRVAQARGWTVAPDSGRGFRRVVPSPAPTRIREVTAVRALLRAGLVVVAGGGGGVPVGPDGGVDAVVDKDATAALLAAAVGADALLLLTAVDAVRLDFGTPQERAVHDLPVGEAEQHLAAGQFPPGSMGPKVRAAVGFIRSGGEVAAITSPGLLAATLSGAAGAGTRILPGRVPGPALAAGRANGTAR
jgi:carbamate kinase